MGLALLIIFALFLAYGLGAGTASTVIYYALLAGGVLFTAVTLAEAGAILREYARCGGSREGSEPRTLLKDFVMGALGLPCLLFWGFAALGPVACFVPPAPAYCAVVFDLVLYLHYYQDWSWLISVVAAFGAGSLTLGVIFPVWGWLDSKKAKQIEEDQE